MTDYVYSLNTAHFVYHEYNDSFWGIYNQHTLLEFIIYKIPLI